MSQVVQSVKRMADYKRVPEFQGKEHLQNYMRNPFFSKPKIIQAPKQREQEKEDDITNFEQTPSIPIPESIPYPEGKYMPPSLPLQQGYYPYNMYLHESKIYNWCACGLSQASGPWCDGMCNAVSTRCRPIQFNVSKSGYYKMCQCKACTTAPFSNGCGVKAFKYVHSTHRGFFEIWGVSAFWFSSLYMWWNFYT